MMILTSIWERYFIKEICKVFIFFLVAFYGLYVLIDYSTHSHSFKNYHMSFLQIAAFYGSEFIHRMDVLLPFALLLACVKTLCTLNTNNELVALMASGVSLKRLLFPFVVVGLFFTFILYVNLEVLQPYTVKYQKHLNALRTKAKEKKYNHRFIQELPLLDGSSLIFQSYDTVNEEFSDVYWIRSIDDIYRIHYLYPYSLEPLGREVEHLVRNSAGELVITEFFDEKPFPDIHFNAETLLQTATSVYRLSISSLKAKLPIHNKVFSEKEAQILTAYHYKLVQPWMCLFAIIAPASFCMRFSRTLPVFFIYAFSLFGLFAIYLVMDAAVILGERQVIPPVTAIWVPFGCFMAFFSWKVFKL